VSRIDEVDSIKEFLEFLSKSVPRVYHQEARWQD
jgi:hypothetical protein